MQANIASNPNRPTEYRTVTAPQQGQPMQDLEAEERELSKLTKFADNGNFQIIQICLQAVSNLAWVTSFSIRFLWARHPVMAIGTQPLHALLQF